MSIWSWERVLVVAAYVSVGLMIGRVWRYPAHGVFCGLVVGLFGVLVLYIGGK